MDTEPIDNHDADEDEYEEEEHLVYLNFEAKFLEDQLKDSSLKMDIIGIDTDNPILQVNSKLFRGKSVGREGGMLYYIRFFIQMH